MLIAGLIVGFIAGCVVGAIAVLAYATRNSLR